MVRLALRRELEAEIRRVDLNVKIVVNRPLGGEFWLATEQELTKQEHDRCATGKFQDVSLFGVVVISTDLTIPCYYIEAISQYDHVNRNLAKMGKGVKKQCRR